MTTPSVTATLSPAVDPSRTFVLASFRTSASNAQTGARMLRAQLTNGTTITIDRAITGSPAETLTVAWQAIELKDGTKVQRGSEPFASGVAQKIVTLAEAADPARSVAFASVQPVGGQAMGRSPYNVDDVIGVGAATLALSPTQLTLDRNITVDTADVGWFVVQFAGRRVMLTGD